MIFKRTLLVFILGYAGSFIGSQVATQEEVQDYDLFKAADIGGFAMKNYYWGLNSYLIDKTDSAEPADNFDVILDNLSVELKKQKLSNYVKAERLFLSLMTLNTENECSPFSHKILVGNYYASESRVKEIGSNPASPRRIEKILSFYLHRAVSNCNKVYIKKFKKIYPTMDSQLVKRVEFLVEKAIDSYTSSEYQQHAPLEHFKTLSHRLLSIVKRRSYSDFAFDSIYIYEAMKTLVKGDPLEKFVYKQPNERLGELVVNREKFTQLFQKYIENPCKYYLSQLNSIFDPATFDINFHFEVAENEEAYYRAWLTYLLCAVPDWDYKLKATIFYVNTK